MGIYVCDRNSKYFNVREINVCFRNRLNNGVNLFKFFNFGFSFVLFSALLGKLVPGTL